MGLTEWFKRKNIIFVLFVLVIIVAILSMPDIFASPYTRMEERYLGRVIEIDNNLVKQFGLVKTGTQKLKVHILKGPYKGQVIDASNNLLGKMETDKVFRNGDRVYVVLTTDGKKILSATAYDHYRLAIEFLLVILFAVLLFIFAGLGGLKVLLSLVATFIIIWKVMLPMMLKGHDPLWIAIGTVMLITGITLFLVAGVTRTAIVAWDGTFMGISLTALLAFLLFPRFRLHGAIQPFSETLLYSGFDYIDLGRLFIASIFIGASGAVADISIDMAAAMREVVQKRPEIGGVELARSGLNVGRAAASVMITTLVMAYISGYMALLMILISKGIPAVQVLNLTYIAAEIMKLIVGVFGLVTVVPFTATAGGLLFKRIDFERRL